MIRNRELPDLAPAVMEGVMIHRAIDTFTDAHPEIRQLVGQLRPVHGKYAPVAVDVILDFILTTDWEHHAAMTFEDFSGWVYFIVDEHSNQLPDRVRPRVQGMRKHQWLDQYRTKAGIYNVLQRLDQRARFPSRFAEGLADLDQHYPALRQGLRSFYPDLRAFTRHLIDQAQ